MGELGARLLPAAVALGILGLLSEAACRRQPSVATAVTAEGSVKRTRGGTSEAVVPGSTFSIGDTLSTGAASRALLALSGGGLARVGENARLRFQHAARVGQEAADIAVQLGWAEVENATSDLSIATAVGTARLSEGARVRVSADGQTASLEVIVGRAVILDADREVAVEAGQGVRIRIGSAEIHRFALKIGEAVIEEIHAQDGSARASDGVAADMPLAGKAPKEADPSSGGVAARAGAAASARADITLIAGETATLHVGRPPTAVRLRVDQVCDGDAVVELGGRRPHERVTGSRSVVLRLRTGTRSYSVRCARDGGAAVPRAAGVLTVRRDTGYVPLARRPPANVIDADGRKYTVLFQTRLPRLTFAWSAAPAGGGDLELHVEPAVGGERVVRLASPSRPLPAGTVQEGTYTMWYRTSDGKQSPKTTLTIRFDNAAPTAQFFRTPAEDAHGAVVVDGVTVEGAKVTFGGDRLVVDGQGRFRAEARPLEGDEAVAVRIEHPRSGIHYYLRRRTGPR